MKEIAKLYYLRDLKGKAARKKVDDEEESGIGNSVFDAKVRDYMYVMNEAWMDSPSGASKVVSHLKNIGFKGGQMPIYERLPRKIEGNNEEEAYTKGVIGYTDLLAKAVHLHSEPHRGNFVSGLNEDGYKRAVLETIKAADRGKSWKLKNDSDIEEQYYKPRMMSSKEIAIEKAKEIIKMKKHFLQRDKYETDTDIAAQIAIRPLDGVSFDMHQGLIPGIVGESGSGKKTIGYDILKETKKQFCPTTTPMTRDIVEAAPKAQYQAELAITGMLSLDRAILEIRHEDSNQLFEKYSRALDMVLDTGMTREEFRAPKATVLEAERRIIDFERSNQEKEIELKDKFENMGAQMVKVVASKTADVAGDGTTTATVLAQAIVNEGSKSVAVGMNPMDLKRGIDEAVNDSGEFLSEHPKSLDSYKTIAQVGSISANSGEPVGVIIVEENKSIQNEGEVVEDMPFEPVKHIQDLVEKTRLGKKAFEENSENTLDWEVIGDPDRNFYKKYAKYLDVMQPKNLDKVMYVGTPIVSEENPSVDIENNQQQELAQNDIWVCYDAI